ncbi:hypothetical protein GCM10029976_042560 [Kribbella albertanoniae]|uniref:Uncharacterized protein n=1 Tax=Kribbella albertanoniae TaxID=1266829 RepID=A0A4R4QEZ6_9ACTN|nr:hypothetical protein [Kribbella albertanoniae]TDC34040.1 hypothetical protein E1261_04865 [Kribbella albertanoniae]
MGASDRAAALRRARERQARIEAATARTVLAHSNVKRAVEAKAQAMERHDERIAAAELTSETETTLLAKVCGSAEAAAEILGISQREVRRMVRAERERQAVDQPRARGWEVQHDDTA